MKFAVVSNIRANYEAQRITARAFINSRSPASLHITSGQASRALWEDRRVSLMRYNYPFHTTVAEIRRMPVSSSLQDQLIHLLKTGDLMVGKE